MRELLQRLINEIDEELIEEFSAIQPTIDECKKLLATIDKLPRALYNIIVVKPIEREQTNGGLLMPDEKTLYGIVMSKGKKVEDVEVGDTLMFVYGVYEEFDFENETYYVMVANSDNIKAVL